MVGLAPKDGWLLVLLVVCTLGFLAAARWSSRLTDGRPIVLYSVGFSLGFVVLVLATGILVLR